MRTHLNISVAELCDYHKRRLILPFLRWRIPTLFSLYMRVYARKLFFFFFSTLRVAFRRYAALSGKKFGSMTPPSYNYTGGESLIATLGGRSRILIISVLYAAHQRRVYTILIRLLFKTWKLPSSTLHKQIDRAL